ncbi:Glycosyl transferase [uncultured Gammaproteobacteria bacterium]
MTALKGLRVLQVLPSLAANGLARDAVEVALCLAQNGAVPLVVSSGGPLQRELDRAGIAHLTIPALASRSPWSVLANDRHLTKIVHAHVIEVVHAHSRLLAWAGWRAAGRCGATLVTTCHALYPTGSWVERWRGAAIARGVRVIAVSEHVRDHLLTNFPVTKDAVSVVRPGLDLALFTPDQVKSTRLIHLARVWNLPDDRPIILVPGRLQPGQGQMELIEALGRLGRRDLCCLMVEDCSGDTAPANPGYRRLLEQRIEGLGLGGSVRFLDTWPDPTAAYMLATMVVSPARNPEGFPRTILEAMAMGRPTVLTDHGSAREVAVPGVSWLVPPANPEAMAEAVAAVLALNTAERINLAERAIDHVRQRFSRERAAAEIIAVYREVVKRD